MTAAGGANWVTIIMRSGTTPAEFETAPLAKQAPRERDNMQKNHKKI
jgi:hypothetical protein